jgi:AmmeMemoRadiSam system protein A
VKVRTDAGHRQLLLRIAREAVRSHAHGLGTSIPAEVPEPLTRFAGAFVTLRAGGDLRGCIGHVEPDRPLAAVVVHCAVAASSADPRFPPVSASELDRIGIEVSILGPLERVTALDEIEIGRHGLVVERAWRRGLLLPQVAIEWRWDQTTFVAETCRKAGLPLDAWGRGATLWRFDAEVFSEWDEPARPGPGI